MIAPVFELPHRLEATEPPEARGLARDGVRLMVAERGIGSVADARFTDLPAFLREGDLLVVNTSATLPAAVEARRAGGEPVRVHFSTPAPQLPETEWWIVELRTAGGAEPLRAVRGERLRLEEGGGELEIVAPYAGGARLWLARADLPSGETVAEHLARNGHAIRYGYLHGEWPIDAYQTTFAREPGSAEMASAGRPFTPELVTELVTRGVLLAPITLHAGVSSPERHEAPNPERYDVPATTARLVNAVHGWGGRVIAIGTTVVRALESVARPDGCVHAGSGWTGLVVTPERGLRAVDGLLTGWHEPEASHLRMLQAAAGDELLALSYDEALEHGYLWHEFGDSHLILR